MSPWCVTSSLPTLSGTLVPAAGSLTRRWPLSGSPRSGLRSRLRRPPTTPMPRCRCWARHRSRLTSAESSSASVTSSALRRKAVSWISRPRSKSKPACARPRSIGALHTVLARFDPRWCRRPTRSAARGGPATRSSSATRVTPTASTRSPRKWTPAASARLPTSSSRSTASRSATPSRRRRQMSGAALGSGPRTRCRPSRRAWSPFLSSSPTSWLRTARWPRACERLRRS